MVQLTGLDRPRERGAHVVALRDHEVVPLRASALRGHVGCARDLEVVLGVQSAKIAPSLPTRRAVRRRARGSSRASRSAAGRDPDAARGSCRRGSAACPGRRRDRLGRVIRAATREDRKRAEERLLRRLEQVMRPLDSRPEGLLARIGVAARAEEIETLGQALEELLRREDERTGGCELQSEREVVEPSAELARPRPRARRRRRACAHVRKSSTPSHVASGGTGYTCSPCSRRRSRLVTRIVGPGMSRRRAILVCDVREAGARRCRAERASVARQTGGDGCLRDRFPGASPPTVPGRATSSRGAQPGATPAAPTRCRPDTFPPPHPPRASRAVSSPFRRGR